MCGIFGVVSSRGVFTPNQMAFMKAATITGQLRGEDGTGWILQDAFEDIRTYKKAMHGTDFLDTRIGTRASQFLYQACTAIGHNRKSTSGRNVDSDCHPYNYDHLVGVHNGGIPLNVLSTLDTKDTIANVDSAKLYAALNSVVNPVDVLQQLHAGSFVLAWIDKRTNTLNLTRNKERPLWLSVGDKGIYFASEPGMLFWLMTRFNLECDKSELILLDEHVLYSISLDNPVIIDKTKYEVITPVYPSRRTHYPPVTDKTPWINRSTSDNFYKFIGNCSLLIQEFPALAGLTSIIQSNLDYISKEYADNNVNSTGRSLDVVITKVYASPNSSAYLNAIGYLYNHIDDESNVVIPINIKSIKTGSYGLRNYYKKAQEAQEYLTMRVSMQSIRLGADGTIIICCGIDTVWDKDSNVPITADAEVAAKEVDYYARTRPTALSNKEMGKKWAELRIKVIH